MQRSNLECRVGYWSLANALMARTKTLANHGQERMDKSQPLDNRLHVATAVTSANPSVKKSTPCVQNPESPKIAFALFWMMVGRLAYLWPVFVIHSTKGDTNGNWMSIFEIGSVLFTSCSSIFLFRAWKVGLKCLRSLVMPSGLRCTQAK